MKLHWVKFLDRVDDYGTRLLDFELNLPGAWAGITSQRVQGGEWRSAFTIRVKPGWVQHGLSTNPGAAKARVRRALNPFLVGVKT